MDGTYVRSVTDEIPHHVALPERVWVRQDFIWNRYLDNTLHKGRRRRRLDGRAFRPRGALSTTGASRQRKLRVASRVAIIVT
ncbi:hypothetical protein F2Q69_00054412 [Brassica cretica]|uniref:Uncharacterized protein n=1 Tax=Brassica cretica TaxID=69181 RepID=A0A8S9NB11_BRACR|nr:hypothetical protein F2Q69_00054412 [Brassica cretica]